MDRASQSPEAAQLRANVQTDTAQKDTAQHVDRGTDIATKPVYNILLLGQTQAGKSTFLQGIRRYADPTCQIDTSLIGNGNQSHTSDVKMQQVDTNFPYHRLYKTDDGQESVPYLQRLSSQLFSYLPFLSDKHGTNGEINVESLLQNCTVSEYRARIDRTDGIEIRKDDQSTHPESTIRIFDTPGLEDSNHQDEKNVSKILTSLSKEEAVHLVLIVISRGTPLTPGLQAALKTYSNIFSAMSGLLAVVHTHFEYRHQHEDDNKTKAFMTSREADLNSLMGRDMMHFKIDCDLDEDRPIHIYLRQNTIREILLLVTLNIPVKLNRMQLSKTRKMIDVDDLTAREQARIRADLETQYRLVDSIIDLDIKINEARYNIRELNEFLKNNETDTHEFMREERYEEGWGFFASRKEVELRVSHLPYNIDHIQVHSQGVRVLHQDGGWGRNQWYIKLMREWFQHGVYHAKLYVLRRNKMQHEISDKKSKLGEWRKAQEKLVRERQKKDRMIPPDSRTHELRQELKKKQGECLDMIARAHRKTLHLNLFNALVREGVYEGTLAECMDKIKVFYSSYSPAEGEEIALEHDQSSD